MIEYFEDINCAVTICDKSGIILFMNKKANSVFNRFGGDKLIGTSLFQCHNEKSIKKIHELLSEGGSHTYTISKNGVKKIIHQLPWFQNGAIEGLIEFSFELPDDMNHYQR